MNVDSLSLWCYTFDMETKNARHFDNDKKSFLIFEHYFEYCETIYTDILYIQKHYQEEFNAISKFKINDYKRLFELLVKEFYRTCYDNKKFINETYVNMLSPENQTYYYIQDQVRQTSNREDFYCGDLINPIYYKKIEKITNKIFELEESMSKITNQFWTKILAKSVDDIKDGKKFACLAKVLVDWRKDNASTQLSNYMDSRYAMSVSYITNYKSRFFAQDYESAKRIGILYYTDAIIAGYHLDAYLEEYINKKCPLKSYNVYSNINRMKVCDNHEIFAYASKIATPLSVLFQQNDTRHTSYNEVIIDKRKAKPFAVFCIRNIDGKKVQNYDSALHMAKQMAEKFNLPLVELDSKNEFENEDENTINMENL